MYLYHAQNDEFIPNTGTDRVVEDYCRDPNARITYTRELLAEHLSGIVGWLPDGYQFLFDRMNGVPVAKGCAITSPFSTLTDGDFAALLGVKWPLIATLLTGYPLGARVIRMGLLFRYATRRLNCANASRVSVPGVMVSLWCEPPLPPRMRTSPSVGRPFGGLS
ncbi:lipase family protein [Nocardia yamanashiensis]|uniref:lipase family protein n=1 Tax=Nocardia yamanashiensis TaxID=209247 RepID=UPI001E374528|nr:lipase family protein [Nocardia yamanashiensis]UGT41616.1 lipase family protein [Nocardia yamanashiensis]